MGGVNGPCDDADVGASGSHCTHDVGACSFLKINVDVWMLCQECRQQLRQILQHSNGIHMPSHMATQALGIAIKVAAHLLQLLYDSACMLEQRGPCRSKRTPRRPRTSSSVPTIPPPSLECARSPRPMTCWSAMPRGDVAARPDMQEQPQVDQIVSERHGQPSVQLEATLAPSALSVSVRQSMVHPPCLYFPEKAMRVQRNEAALSRSGYDLGTIDARNLGTAPSPDWQLEAGFLASHCRRWYAAGHLWSIPERLSRIDVRGA